MLSQKLIIWLHETVHSILIIAKVATSKSIFKIVTALVITIMVATAHIAAVLLDGTHVHPSINTATVNPVAWFRCFHHSSHTTTVELANPYLVQKKKQSQFTIQRLKTYIHIHTFNGLFSRTIRVSRHQTGKPLWILLKQEIMDGSGISWTICKSFAPHSRQITTPVPPSLNFLRAGCSSWCPTNSVKDLKVQQKKTMKAKQHATYLAFHYHHHSCYL